MATNHGTALFVGSDNTFSIRHDLAQHRPFDNEVLVHLLYSGINPADTKHSEHLGIKDTVLGYDFCGTILEARAGSGFEVGDVAAGYTPTSLGRPLRYGTHQATLACPKDMLFRVPTNLPQAHAAALAVVVSTAADAMFNHFNLPLPGKTNTVGGSLLIWGASSSVGISALQFARAIGIKNVLVTASPSRHKLLKELGATYCFDYSDPEVVNQIKTTLGNESPIYALDAIGSPNSASLTLACSSDTTILVSTTIQRDPRFKMPLATANSDVQIHPHGPPHPITIPARPEAAKKMWSALLWAVEGYGTVFRLPAVEVFEGSAEEALETVKKVGDGAAGFGKIVLKHPLR